MEEVKLSIFNTGYHTFLSNPVKINKKLHVSFGKFSISPVCIRKIPLNPPLQKGEEVEMRGLIELPLSLMKTCA
jgi:hypothetical protein